MKKEKLFPTIAFYCLVLFSLHNIFFLGPFFEIPFIGGYIPSLIQIIHWVILIGLCIALLLKKRILCIAAFIAFGLYKLYSLINQIIYNVQALYSESYEEYIPKISDVIFSTFISLSRIVAVVAVIVLLILSVKKHVIVSKVWAIPGIITLSSIFLGWINSGVYYILSLVCDIFFIVAIFCIGLWLKNLIPKKNNEYERFIPETEVVSSALIEGADIIKSYKELFDEGIITQTDFKQKKAQVLERVYQNE